MTTQAAVLLVLGAVMLVGSIATVSIAIAGVLAGLLVIAAGVLSLDQDKFGGGGSGERR